MNVKDTVDVFLQEYKQFMRIDDFPEYEISIRNASLNIADNRGYESAAGTHYIVAEDKHTLFISANLPLLKYLLFHEFTHILDTEIFAKNDKLKYMGLSGYTEYHASQIELKILLNAQFLDTNMSFSMNDKIETIAGTRTIQDYVFEKYQHTIDLFSRQDFPLDIEMLKSALGVWYNYMGLDSLCKIYARDYVNFEEKNDAIIKFISTQQFAITKTIMQGYLSEDIIVNMAIPLYCNTIVPIIKDYNLV